MIPQRDRSTQPEKRLRNVFRVSVDKLDFHPRLALVPLIEAIPPQIDNHGDPVRKKRLARLSSDWDAFIADIAANGVQDPVKVIRGADDRYFVCDGRNRVTGARRAGKASVPAILVNPEDVDMIVTSTVIGRRHWTKSMKAWLAVLMNPEVVTRTRANNSRPDASDKIGSTTRESLGGQYGVSADMIDQACRIHALAYKNGKQTEWGKRTEPGIWLGNSLGGALSGIGADMAAGEEGQAGKPRKPSGPAGVVSTLNSIKLKTANFSEWTPEQIALFEDRLPEILAEWDLDFIAVLRRHLEAVDEVTIDPTPAKPAKAAKPTKAKPAPVNDLIVQGLLKVATHSLQFDDAVRQATVAEMDAAIAAINPNDPKLKGKALEEATYRRTLLEGERTAKLKIAEINARS